MPTYDYVCDACGDSFEAFQSIKADALVQCQKCGKKKLRRLIGPGAAIVFKGSGFYLTDYRSDSYKKRAESERKATSEGKSSEGGKSSSAGGEATGKSAEKKASKSSE